MASDITRMRRSSRRPLKKKKPVRLAAVLFLVAVLLVVGGYYVFRYPIDRDYAEYPLKYQELIEKYAAEYSLECAHVAAVIRCESSFRPQVQSSAGALGLMQLMPDTAGWIAGKLDERDSFTADMLTDPETNLRYGCWYLSWLMERYGGDMKLATCAYHTGQGNVDKWLEDENLSADGITLDTIPSDATRNYAEKVLTAYEKYKKLYTFNSPAA